MSVDEFTVGVNLDDLYYKPTFQIEWICRQSIFCSYSPSTLSESVPKSSFPDYDTMAKNIGLLTGTNQLILENGSACQIW